MKIHELIAELQKLPQDWEVILADDAVEIASPVFEVACGWYDREEREFTTLILEIDTPDERLHRERKIEECNAVCIWP